MKIKLLDENTIPAKYKFQTESAYPNVSQRNGKSYFYLGIATKDLSFTHRIKIALRACLTTLFTLNVSEKSRDDFKSARTGSRNVKLCASSPKVINKHLTSTLAKSNLDKVISTIDWATRLKQNLWTGLGVD